MRLEAKTKAGVWCCIQFEDKSDTVPMFDKDGNRVEAFTDWFRIANGSAILGIVGCNPNPNGACDMEDYVQISRMTLNCADEPRRLRQRERLRFLDAAGIDISTIRIPPVFQGPSCASLYSAWFEADAELIEEARRAA